MVSMYVHRVHYQMRLMLFIMDWPPQEDFHREERLLQPG